MAALLKRIENAFINFLLYCAPVIGFSQTDFSYYAPRGTVCLSAVFTLSGLLGVSKAGIVKDQDIPISKNVADSRFVIAICVAQAEVAMSDDGVADNGI